MTKLLNLIICLLLLGCSEKADKKFHLMYRADFETINIERVEKYVDLIARENGLRIFRKERAEMAFLSKGSLAFFTALYYKENPIFVVTNVGTSSTLSISITDFGEFPIGKLENLANSFNAYLTNESLVKNLKQHIEK
jgi:hypothetical protein